MNRRPVFSVDADAPPRGTGGPSHTTDIAQAHKEIPCGLAGQDFDIASDVAELPNGRPRAPGYAAKVADAATVQAKARALRLEIERDRATHEDEDGVRASILTAASDLLAPWRFAAFAAWFRADSSKGREHIAKELGVSRATVRAALDGGGLKRAGPGAIAIMVAALGKNDTFKQAVMSMAKKNKQRDEDSERPLVWFQGIDNKPDMVVPLAMLLVLDALADTKREVKIGDVIPHFPRSLITPCMTLLKAHGFAASDGHVIRIVKVPAAKEAA